MNPGIRYAAGELRVALVAPVTRHLGTVLAVRRTPEQAIEAYFRDHFEPMSGRALVVIGAAVEVGAVVSLSGARVVREVEIRIRP